MTPDNAPITIPASGGTFTYDVAVKNYETTAQNFDGWIDILLPDSSVFGPVILRTGLQLAASGTIIRNDLSQTIPAAAPAGTYIMRAHTGVYPNDTGSLSTFTFEKSAATAQNSQLGTRSSKLELTRHSSLRSLRTPSIPQRLSATSCEGRVS